MLYIIDIFEGKISKEKRLSRSFSMALDGLENYMRTYQYVGLFQGKYTTVPRPTDPLHIHIPVWGLWGCEEAGPPFYSSNK